MAEPNAEQLKQDLILNAMMQRSELLQKLLDPRRDLEAECGYPTGGLDPHGYRKLYDEDPIANKVVGVLPRESWKNEPEVYEDEDSEATTEFETAWETLSNSLRGRSWYRGQGEEGSPIWEYLRRADELSGVGCFGILLLGLDDGQELSKPVRGVEEKWSEPVDIMVKDQELTAPKPTGNVYSLNVDKDKTKGRRLLFMRAFDESLVQIAQYETNPTSPRYGMPVMYSVTFNDPNEWTKGGIGLPFATKLVHWTRVIHVADNCGSSEIFGTPRQKPVLPRILDLRKLYGGSAEMYWRGAFPGWSLETHPQLGGDVNVDAGALREQMEQYMNGLQRYMALMGMTAKSLAPQVVDPSAQIDVQIGAICIELDIPRRIFEGSERGDLASSQDSGSWNDRMRSRQGKYITPRIIIPFIDRCIMIGVLPEPQGYAAVWPDLEALSDLEKAQVAVQRVDAMAKYIGGNVEALIAPLDFFTRILEMSQTEAEEILEGATEQLEKTHPDTEDEIVPGHVPAPPAPEELPPMPIKVKDGERLMTPDGMEVGKSQRPFQQTENYNPSQPRDSDGKFGSGGGGGGGSLGDMESQLPGSAPYKISVSLSKTEGRTIEEIAALSGVKATQVKQNMKFREKRGEVVEKDGRYTMTEKGEKAAFGKKAPDVKPPVKPVKPPVTPGKSSHEIANRIAGNERLTSVADKVSALGNPASRAVHREAIDKFTAIQEQSAKALQKGANQYRKEHPGISPEAARMGFQNTPEGAALRTQQAEAVGGKLRHQRMLAEETEALTEKAHELLALPKSQRTQVQVQIHSNSPHPSDHVKPPTPKFETRAEKGAEFVASVTSKDTVPYTTVNARRVNGRAFERDGVGIFNDENDSVSVYVHEMAHHLEYTLPNANRNAQDFKQYRIAKAGKPDVRMRKFSRSYRADEVGNSDDFEKLFNEPSHAAYVGKHYLTGNTEVLSMGMQLLHRDPVRFAETDPEFFKFVVGTIQGDL